LAISSSKLLVGKEVISFFLFKLILAKKDCHLCAGIVSGSISADILAGLVFLTSNIWVFVFNF